MRYYLSQEMTARQKSLTAVELSLFPFFSYNESGILK